MTDRAAAVTAIVRRFVQPAADDDDLFEAGLTSLGAMDLLEAMRIELRIDLPFRVLLEEPTLRGVVDAALARTV